MAFSKGSRYSRVPTVQVKTTSGRGVSAVSLRILPDVDGEPYTLEAHDRLDLLASRFYQDPTRFWRIADANSEPDVGELLRPGRVIRVPKNR